MKIVSCVPELSCLLFVLTFRKRVTLSLSVDACVRPHREGAAGATADLHALRAVALRTENHFVAFNGHSRLAFAIGLVRDWRTPITPVAHLLRFTLDF